MSASKRRMGAVDLGPDDYAVHWSVAKSFGVSTEVYGSKGAALARAGVLMGMGSHVTLLGVNQNVPRLTEWVDCRGEVLS